MENKQSTLDNVTLVSKEKPFLTPAYVWTGITYFHKIHPCFMYFDGTSLSFIDVLGKELDNITPQDVVSMKYKSGLITIKTNRPVINKTTILRIQFYQYQSNKATVPPAYEQTYQDLLDRLSASANKDSAEALLHTTDYSPMTIVASLGALSPAFAGASAIAGYRLAKVSFKMDAVAQIWVEVLSKTFTVQRGSSAKKSFTVSMLSLVPATALCGLLVYLASLTKSFPMIIAAALVGCVALIVWFKKLYLD